MSYKSLSNAYLFRNASISATLSAAGVAVGLLVDAMILGFFGVGYHTDAFFTALTIPTLLSGVFSIQCPKVLIPIFSEYFGRNDESEAWTLLSNLLTLCFIVLTGICLVGAAASMMIIRLQIPGLEMKTIALGAELSRILCLLLLSQGLASILQSVLYARHRYLVSSSGKVVGNIVTIVATIVGHAQFGVRAVAAGMVLGGFVQVGLLLITLMRDGFRYRYILKPVSKVPQIMRAFRYTLAGHVLGESATILHNVLGSFLGAGSITVMRYASRVVQAIAGILLGSVVQVTLPLMARHAVTNDLKAQRKALLESIQLLAVAGVPICIWLTLTARPLISLLFERGEFSSANVALTALLIQFMIPDLLLGRLVSVTQTLFYSNMDIRTPFISTVLFTVANTIFAIVLVRSFGVVGLPIAVSMASISNALYMIFSLQRRFGPIGWVQLSSFSGRLVASCVVGAAGLAVGTKMAAMLLSFYSLEKLANVAVPTTLGVLTFIGGALLFRLVDAKIFKLATTKTS